MVDLLSHIETIQISKSNLLNLTVHFDHPGHFDYFSSNTRPHYNSHLMVISTKTFAVQNNHLWLNRFFWIYRAAIHQLQYSINEQSSLWHQQLLLCEPWMKGFHHGNHFYRRPYEYV